MRDTFATLRKPDASDIEAIRSFLEEFVGRSLPQADVNQMLAAALRGRLSPTNPLRGGDDEAAWAGAHEEGVGSIDTPAADAPATSLAHHHFTLPEHLGQGQLRTVVREGEPWFVAADVAVILEYSHTPSMVRGLDDDEKGVHSVHTLGGIQEMSVINTSGLFSLILASRKPQAKPFKRWVTHEVLPSIARTGGYQDDSGSMDEVLRAATDGHMGTAPQVPPVPGLSPDIQVLITLLVTLAPRLQDWLAAWLDKQTRALLPRTTPAYADQAWFHILRGQALLHGRTNVARELGVSLPQVSQVLNFSGLYGTGAASPHTLAEKVLARFAEPPRTLGLQPAPAPAQAELPV